MIVLGDPRDPNEEPPRCSRCCRVVATDPVLVLDAGPTHFVYCLECTEDLVPTMQNLGWTLDATPDREE
jgi:hypothetical protein